MKRIIGTLMLISIFAGIFIVGSIVSSVTETAFAFAAAAIVIVIVIAAVGLITTSE
jgi:hypothetical protein